MTAEVLTEALPYIRRFGGKTVVVKFGGNAMVDPELSRSFAKDMVLLQSVGLRPVVVHGGGPQIGQLMSRLGKVPEFRDGLRVTDAETLDIVRMVLVGKVGRDIVGAINVHAPVAVGLSGEDAGLLLASEHNPELGFAGDVKAVNAQVIDRLLDEGFIPVISTIGTDLSGQAYNVNADTGAGAIAAELGAEKVMYLTDVPGLLGDVSDHSTLISDIDTDELAELIASGSLTEGMIPKMAACLAAVRGGVGAAHLLDGRIPHVVLLELFTDAGIGTMITLPEEVSPR